MRSLTLATVLFCLCPLVQAQQAQDFGGFTVHYSAVSTDMLAAEVVRGYGITRSRSRALLNIAVLRKTEDGLGTPITAEVSATATNLNGQLTSVRMREVREQDAVYYLGELRVSHEETFDFEVSVKPEGEERPRSLRFRQQFFTD